MKSLMNKLTFIKNPFIKIFKMRTLIITILACAIMACSLFLIKSITSDNPEEAAAAGISVESQQHLQSQINDLSHQVSNLNNSLSKLQSPTTGDKTDQQLLNKMDSFSSNINNISAELDSVQTAVNGLQGKIKVAETTIGSIPMTVNNLSVVFITNDIDTGLIAVNNTSTTQFAVKIINNTGSSITNLDVTGTITASEAFADILAAGYPQIIDGAGAFNYVFFMEEGREIHFEAFGGAKSSQSIPNGGSITLRPKISLLAKTGFRVPDLVLRIGLNTITYDKVANDKLLTK
jgi:hypothetical protein